MAALTYSHTIFYPDGVKRVRAGLREFWVNFYGENRGYGAFFVSREAAAEQASALYRIHVRMKFEERIMPEKHYHGAVTGPRFGRGKT